MEKIVPRFQLNIGLIQAIQEQVIELHLPFPQHFPLQDGMLCIILKMDSLQRNMWQIGLVQDQLDQLAEDSIKKTFAQHRLLCLFQIK
ncbi:MAG: hypothetical protein ACOYYU_10475 [Chloroflexota bacterium]